MNKSGRSPGVKSWKPRLFDLHLHAEGLADADLATLAYFGVEAAMTCAHDAGAATAKSVLAHFDDLCGRQSERLLRAGIRPLVGLGVHPGRIPWHGLRELLHALPEYLGRRGVVALGEIGLEHGGPREETLLLEQLELARRLRLPVLVHTPERDKARLTRRTLALLRESGIPPDRAVVDHVTPVTFALVRACGFRAGLTLRPGELSVTQAATLIERHGSEGLHLSSDAGDGPADLLGLPRAVALLEQRVPAQVVRRVAFENSAQLLGVERVQSAGRPETGAARGG